MPYTFNSCTPQKNGFTIIEIAIVLAIISIILVFAMPKFQGVKDHYTLEASAQKVAETLRFSKQLAMDRRESVALVFEGNDLIIYIKDLDGNWVAYGNQYTIDPGIELNISQSYGLSTGLSAGIAGHYISFDYRGFIEQHTTIPGYPQLDARLKLEKGAQEAHINIAKVTGYVTVE